MDRIARRERPWYVPPRRFQFVGGGDFLRIGGGFRELFRSVGGLQATDDVLDVGCGVGRMAIPLVEFLEPTSRYEGFDVVPWAVEWCRRTISSRYPNFSFRTSDLHNERYNPKGRVSAADYSFPYEDESFDFVISTSVFTHLRPSEIRNYLRESARVLRPGGRLFGTWFLLDAERQRARRRVGDERTWFPVGMNGCRVVSSRAPEFAIAFEERSVLRWLAEAGLPEATVEYGSWLGAEGPTWQDIIVAVKPSQS
jgi:SAM-dependent methyltransferase